MNWFPPHTSAADDRSPPADRLLRCALQAMSLLGCLSMLMTGCSLPTWIHPQPCVFTPDVSKEELVAYINRNIVGTDQTSGLMAWRTSTARLNVTGIPIRLPASIAVEAPRRFRIRVSNPMSGGQELDMGANDERFWVWSKDAPQVVTASHEDLPLAMQYLQMPVPIRPDWLMEVFGVIPIDPAQFQLAPVAPGSPEVDLVSHQRGPNGVPVQRVIRVNTCRGTISQHLLRDGAGHLIARAVLDKYTLSPHGITMPQVVHLDWPEAEVEMTIQLGQVDVNPPGLSQNTVLWQVPRFPGTRTLDVGLAARKAMNGGVAPVGLTPAARAPELEPPGRVWLHSYEEKSTERPQRPPPPGSLPNWATENTSMKPVTEPTSPTVPTATTGQAEAQPTPAALTADEPPSEYSAAAWRSSSDRHRQAPE